MERTYVMIKPDGMAKGLAGVIEKRIETAGFKVTKKKDFFMTEKLVREHYDFLVDKPFFAEILKFMTCGIVCGMVVEGEGVIAGVRGIAGVTNPNEAAEGTIRKEFGTDKMRNVVHASDSPETAEIEIARFFG